MTKYDIMELVVVALGIICLAVTIPMWLRIRRDMIRDFKEEQENREASSGGGEAAV